ncbi:MAG TPA: hypothetical protein EYH01_08485 [Campylobacterales bacterium]|nr:hypothetical protein [Campylobacterales bacterium]
MSAVVYEGNRAILNGNVFEDELVGLRSFIRENGENAITFNLSACNDMHTAIVQLLVAAKATKECEFTFSDKTKPFAMAIEGFKVEEKI